MPRTVKPRQEGRLTQTLDRSGQATQDQVDRSPIVSGVFTDLVEIAAASAGKIPHKLGKKPNGYILCRVKATAAITEQVRETDFDENFISLFNDSGVNVSVQLYVF
jgi:inhibitor of KinA sporulation pathway (predicted exonuclease)